MEKLGECFKVRKGRVYERSPQALWEKVDEIIDWINRLEEFIGKNLEYPNIDYYTGQKKNEKDNR